jgi:hypothetical protein
MPLPSSGPISFSQINTERGVSSTASLDFNWIRNNSNSNNSGSGAAVQISNMAGLYGLSWYLRQWSSPSDKHYLQTSANDIDPGGGGDD